MSDPVPVDPIPGLTHIGNVEPRSTTYELERTDTGFEATVTIEGAITGLKAAVKGTYKMGAKITVLDVADLEITKSRLGSKPGGVGVLTVTATRERNDSDDEEEQEGGGGGGGGGDNPEATFHVEVDYTTVTRPIADNPAFAGIDAEGWAQIRRWQALAGNSALAQRYAAFDAPTILASEKEGGPDPNDNSDWNALPTANNVKAYAQLVYKGVEEYMVQVPVIRKTSVGGSVSASRVGQQDTPSTTTGIESSYQWLKTADRWIRDSKRGKWTHSEEWSGFDSLNPTLYPASGS